jgi:hypothetical protein
MFANVLGSMPLGGYPAGFSRRVVHPLGSGGPALQRGPDPVPRLAERIHTDAGGAEGTEVDRQASAA